MKKITASKKNRLVDEYLQSNLTQVAFSREHNIPVSTFNTWISKYKANQEQRQNKEHTNSQFTLLNEPAPALPDTKQGEDELLIILPNKIKLVITEKFNKQLLKQAIEVASCCLS